MKILHVADTHLDRVFGAADDRRDAGRRRAGLRDALSRALAAGRAEGVGAVVLAGDVYEHASVTADTVAFLAGELERAEVPVLVTPGNHDPYVAGSAWQLTAWPRTSTCSQPIASRHSSSATASWCGERTFCAPYHDVVAELGRLDASGCEHVDVRRPGGELPCRPET